MGNSAFPEVLTSTLTVQLAINEGDAALAARQRLADRYQHAVYEFVGARLGRDPERIYDISRDFLEIMFQGDHPKIKKYDPNHVKHRGFRNWLVTCLLNHLRDLARSASAKLDASTKRRSNLHEAADKRMLTPEALAMQTEEPTEDELAQFNVNWALGVIQQAIQAISTNPNQRDLNPRLRTICHDLAQGIIRPRADYQQQFHLTEARLRILYLQFRSLLRDAISAALAEEETLPFRDNFQLSIDAVFNLVNLQHGPSKSTIFRAKP